MRNVLFDLGWLPSYKPKVTTIAIGNLNTGGTGKTPFTELLIKLLQQKFEIAVISRGYGRKSKGFLYVEPSSNACDVGDEPLQIKQKFSSVKVVVCEKRAEAIKKIESEHPEINLILMDDAFQHRYVRSHINILLSTYNAPYYNDHVLPAGNLRESRTGAKRADYIVITKCPDDLTPVERNAIKMRLKPKAYQHVLFAREKYGEIYDIFSRDTLDVNAEAALLITGIASNSKLQEHLKNRFDKVHSLNLSDHAIYNEKVISEIKKKYESLKKQFITNVITTEKDAVKLRSFKDALSEIPLYVIPFEHDLLEEELFISNLDDKIMR